VGFKGVNVSKVATPSLSSRNLEFEEIGGIPSGYKCEPFRPQKWPWASNLWKLVMIGTL